MRLFRSGGALLLLLIPLASPGAAQDDRPVERVAFRDHGFSVAVPGGWQTIPDSVIRERNSITPPPPGVQDIAGFRPISAPDWFAPPYLMVKVQDTGPVEASELELDYQNDPAACDNTVDGA